MSKNNNNAPVSGGKIWYKKPKITRQQILLALLGFAITATLVQAAAFITSVLTH